MAYLFIKTNTGLGKKYFKMIKLSDSGGLGANVQMFSLVKLTISS